MTTFGFIRHGETDWNVEHRAQGCMDIPLNENGIKQAKALASRFQAEEWDVIYSSPLIRAHHTALAVADVKGIEVIVEDRLKEISFGETEGTTEAERIERWGEDWRNLNLGRETNEEADQRWTEAIHELTRKHPDQKILIVTHGALLVRIFKNLLQDETDRWYGLNNTSFSVFKKQETSWTCELFNCHKHLEETQKA